VSGRARDLVTAADGRCLEVAALTLDLEISPEPAYIITSIAASPDVADLASLVGTSARHGLRWRVTELDLGPGDRTLLLRVLQDVPAVASLSRLALLHGPGDDGQSYRPQGPGLGDRVDICAGWAAGSSMNLLVEDGHSSVRDHRDVPAPAAPADDVLASHPAAELQVGDFRRRRRLDVAPVVRPERAPDDDLVELDAMFRDSFVGWDGVERVEHEYRLRATLHRPTNTFTRSVAVPIVLPATECPLARDSASRLIGRPVTELSSIRKVLTGPTTCTHLTEALHGYADVPSLLALLSSSEED
jgi:hypothetical protein